MSNLQKNVKAIKILCAVIYDRPDKQILITFLDNNIHTIKQQRT